MALLFAVCLVSLLSLVLMGRMLQLRELIMTLGLSLADVVLLFFYLSPFFMLLIIPVACMLGVFLTFLRMSSDNELLALRSGGVSLYRLLPATVLFCVLCAGLTLFTSLFGLSWGMAQFRDTMVEYARNKTQLMLQPGIFNQDFPGLMVYARSVNLQHGLMENIIVEDSTRKGATATILAPLGVLRTVPGRGQVIIALQDGRIYRQEGESVSVLHFDNYQVRLDLTKVLKDFDVDVQKPKEMSWERLRSLNQDPQALDEYDDKYRRKLEVELHKRWVFPAACLVLGLFALPLAMAFEGLRRQLGFFLALGFFMAYYSLLSLGLSLGETGTLNPAVGLWLPNLFFLLLALAGIRGCAEERRFNANEWARQVFQRLRPRKAAADANGQGDRS